MDQLIIKSHPLSWNEGIESYSTIMLRNPIAPFRYTLRQRVGQAE